MAVAPDRQAATVSLANAENVVNPPRKPIISRARVSADSDDRAARQSSASAPISRHPATLTTSVPTGKHASAVPAAAPCVSP